MTELEGDIQINSSQPGPELIEEFPNKEEKVEPNLIIQINDETNQKENDIQNKNKNSNNNPETPKKPNNDLNNTNNDDTNFPISDTNKKGLFSQFENPNIEINQENQDTTISKMTLDEPVLTSLKRDLFLIYNKLKHVITPRFSSHKIEELYNWDLWGPLIFCFLLAISLSNDNNESSTFVLIFSIFWIGGLIITFNGQFLGANIGICQMICLLGYCSFPITLSGIIIGFFGVKSSWIKCFLVFFTFLWSCLASVGFINALVSRDKELITLIPIILFFTTLALFVLNY
jgi:hypothetical protein